MRCLSRNGLGGCPTTGAGSCQAACNVQPGTVSCCNAPKAPLASEWSAWSTQERDAQDLYRRRGRHHRIADSRAARKDAADRAGQHCPRASQECGGQARPDGRRGPGDPLPARRCGARIGCCHRRYRANQRPRSARHRCLHRSPHSRGLGVRFCGARARAAPGHHRRPRVSNPGCYSTGAIALVRPLVDAGLIPRDFPLSLPAVSGYSGGGRSMIEAYEKNEAPAFQIYGLGLTHKHVPEIVKYTGLARRPIFIPAVGNFRQGMLVELPLHLDTLPGKPTAADLHAVLNRHYAGSEWVTVASPTEDGKIDALALNDTDKMELRVYANEQYRQAVLIARLDNLGKGA